MFDSLARLADGHARRIGLIAIAFFLLAGALGGSVASRLDPYGADDPATEAVEAKDQLMDAGLRIPAVMVVVTDAPVAAPATRGRIARLERERATEATSPRSAAFTPRARATSSPATVVRPTSRSR